MRPHYGIARANLGGVRVSVVKKFYDRLFVRHGDRETVNRNVFHAGQQVLQCFGVEGEKHSVHIFAPQRGIHDHGRKRVGNRIPGNAVHPGCGIHLFDSIRAAQILSSDLAGSSLFIRADGSEREHATRAYSEHSAYDSLFPHAQPDQRIFVTLLFQELHHCYVVVERGRGAYDFVEVGRVSSHFMERLFQVLGSAKVVKRNN